MEEAAVEALGLDLPHRPVVAVGEDRLRAVVGVGDRAEALRDEPERLVPADRLEAAPPRPLGPDPPEGSEQAIGAGHPIEVSGHLPAEEAAGERVLADPAQRHRRAVADGDRHLAGVRAVQRAGALDDPQRAVVHDGPSCEAIHVTSPATTPPGRAILTGRTAGPGRSRSRRLEPGARRGDNQRMNAVPWKIAIERALTLRADTPMARWVQLATVGPGGRPAVRTMVFRAFLGRSATLCFTADLRSAKADQIAGDARAEACWTFPESREQFRIAGRLALIGPGHPDPGFRDARIGMWAELSVPSRLTFSWPEPGAPRADSSRFRVAAADPDHPSDTFGLLLLEPERVDHLDLRASPHERILYRRAPGDFPATWDASNVNP